MGRLCYGQMKQVLQSYYILRIGEFGTEQETFYGWSGGKNARYLLSLLAR